MLADRKKSRRFTDNFLSCAEAQPTKLPPP
jgi:hypothetical protein